MISFNETWLAAITDILENGEDVAPRKQATKEILQRTIVVNMRKPVLTISERKLSYKFLAAEAFWILSGDYRVESIAPYNKNISQFSDDGVTFFGAYGPKIVNQLNYIVHKLQEDPDTRQAGLTIWRENPQPSKDIPCTVAVFFNIRGGKLNAHVFMRSSDAWLGVPYDVFNFSMLAHGVCSFLNQGYQSTFGQILEPGDLYLTAASSHLYERNFEAARAVLEPSGFPPVQADTPSTLYTDPERFMQWLRDLRDSKPGDSLRWWEKEDEKVRASA